MGGWTVAKTYVVGQTEIAARPLEAALYLVATPIGNLGDITLRALETLAGGRRAGLRGHPRDPRAARPLWDKAAALAYHEHNAAEAGPKLIAALQAGKSVALVSDAGTPLVSDPGFRLVEQALAAASGWCRFPAPRGAGRADGVGPAVRRLSVCRLPAGQGRPAEEPA